MDRRKHHKVTTFSPEIVELTNKLLDQGWTYYDIAERLCELGHPIGKSSIGRYGKNYLKIKNRIKESTEQSKAIISTAAGAGMNMEEAAIQIALMHIQEFLMDLDKIKGEEATKVMMALARIQNSSVQREKLKIVWREKVDKAADAVESVVKRAKSSGLSDEMAEDIKRKIQGIAA